MKAAAKQSIRFPFIMSIVVAMVMLVGTLPRIDLNAGGPGHNVALSSYSLGNLYQNGELWGGGSDAEKCLACTANTLLQEDSAQSIQPDQNVEPVTGDYTTSDTLFSLPGIYANIGVTLTYDAQRAAVNNAANAWGGFGWGWQSNFDASLNVQGTSVTVNQPNGAQLDFTAATRDGCASGDVQDFEHSTLEASTAFPGSWNSVTPYCAGERVDAQLGLSTYGAYEVNDGGGTDPDSLQLYSAVGQLLYQGDEADPFGAVYNYTVAKGSSGCPMGSEDHCEMVSNGTQNVLAEVAPVYGEVTNIIDPANNVYTLSYTDGDGNLNKVTDPSGDTNSWSFSTGLSGIYQHEMTGVTDGDGHSQSVVYTNDMVTSTTDGTGANTTSYSWGSPSAIDCGLVSGSGVSATLPSDCVDGTQYPAIGYPDGENDYDTYLDSQLESNCGTASLGPCWQFLYSNSSSQNGWTQLLVDSPTGSATVQYDPSWNVVQFTDPNGNTSNYLYNDNGYRSFDELCWSADPTVSVNFSTNSCTSPPTGATTYSYDKEGHLLSETDPLGNVSRYGYYTDGQECWEAPPTVTGSGTACYGSGEVVPTGATLYAYDSYGNQDESVVDSFGSQQEVTQIQYNNLDQRVAEIPADGTSSGAFGSNVYQTNYTYYANGLADTVVGPGVNTTYAYDGAGNQTGVTDVAGATSTAYDGDDRACWTLRSTGTVSTASCTRPSGASATQYVADTSAPQYSFDESGNKTTYTYGNTEFPTKATVVTDPMGASPTFNVYDALGNLCLSGPSTGSNPTSCPPYATATPSGDIGHMYNFEGQLQWTADAGNGASSGVTTYTYGDVRNPLQPTQVAAPYGTTSYSYDTNGNELTETENAGAVVVSTAYDADRRRCWTISGSSPLSGACATPPTGSSAFSYDGAGNLNLDTDLYALSTETAEGRYFDLDNNLTATVDYEGSRIQGVGYTYSTAGLVTCIAETTTVGQAADCTKAPSGTNTVVTQHYNTADQLSSTTDWLNGTSAGNTTQFTNYNARSEVGKITYPSSTGESVQYLYAQTGQLTNVVYAGPAVGSTQDTFTPNADDQVGASTQIGETNPASNSYDDYGRVHLANNLGAASQDVYAYNPNGEVKTDTPPVGSAITFGYNPDEELASVTNPNVPATPDTSIAYTTNGQMCWAHSSTSFIGSPACGSAPSGAESFQWNAYGQLCWSGTTTSTASCGSAPSGATSYAYNGLGNRMSTTTGSSTSYFEWDMVDGGSIPELVSDTKNSYIYGPTVDGVTAPIEQINLSTGVPTYLTSSAEGVEVTFNASGSRLQQTAYTPYGLASQQYGTSQTPFGFQGSYGDPSGLDFMIDRFYDPYSDQFISVDPDVAQTGQPYAFTGDDPLNATDPLGLSGVSSIFACNGQGNYPSKKARAAACHAQKQHLAKWNKQQLQIFKANPFNRGFWGKASAVMSYSPLALPVIAAAPAIGAAAVAISDATPAGVIACATFASLCTGLQSQIFDDGTQRIPSPIPTYVEPVSSYGQQTSGLPYVPGDWLP